MKPQHINDQFPSMGDPTLILDKKWMLVLTPDGLLEFKESSDGDGEFVTVTGLKDLMLPQYRKMLYEWCLKTQQPSSKVEEIHNWLLQHTGRGL